MDDLKAAVPYEGCVALPLGWLLGWGTGAVRALVAMKGWQWFIADTFGVRPLGLVEVWGLLFLISLATMRPDAEPDDRRPFTVMVSTLLVSLTLSGLAFISLLILAGFR